LEGGDPIEDRDIKVHHPVFVGNASEYFHIWVVNTLLSLVTLGIWSAWATVRNRRYLYGNTELAGNRFDFHGNPLAILRGRVLAVIFFSAYALGGDFNFLIPAIAFSLLIILFPWILSSAMRFRLSNTSWRNLRFDFSATARVAYSALGFPMFLVLVAYGLFFMQSQWLLGEQPESFSMRTVWVNGLYFLLASFAVIPLTIYRIRNLTINHTCYGDHDFTAELALGRFLLIFGQSILVALAAIILAVFLFGAIAGGLYAMLGAAITGKFGIFVVIYFLLIPLYLFPYAAWKVATTNYVVCATRFEGLQFKMKMNIWSYWWVMVSNALAAVCSLGLAIPWTQIRMLEYKLSCLTIHGELQTYHGSNVGKNSTTGDEIGDAFDIDFGF